MVGLNCRSEVHFNFRMITEEFLNTPGFVCRQIVRDDVDLFARRILFHDIREESNELFAGMAFCCFAEHLSRACV